MNTRGDANDERLPDRDADALISHWLDEPTDDARLHDSQIDACRVADLTFLDALLERLHDADRQRTKERMERAIAALDDPLLPTATAVAASVPVAPSRRRRLFVAVGTLAAALLATAGVVYWLGGAGHTAQAAVQEAFRMASQPQDRQYAVHTLVRTIRGKTTEFDAMLYTRGADRFALHHPGFLGDLWIGGNGRQYWIKPAIGPSQVVDKLQQPLRWAGTEAFGLPELQMTGLLAYLEQEYDLTLVGDEQVSNPTRSTWRHVRGVRRTGNTERPLVVDLWADPQSGMARRVELDWNRSPQEAGLEYVTIEFAGEEPQVDSWYDAESHLTKPPTLPRSPLLIPSGE